MTSAPFGIAMNSPLADLDVLEDLGEAKYIVNPARRHPRFDTYLVQATENLGVVWVKGISGTVEADAYGVQIRSLMNDVTTQLQRRYGRGEASDLLFPGALWDADREWVMSILQNERMVSHTWEPPKANLPVDLASIYLGILARDRDAACLVLEYASTDLEKAQEEVQESLSDLL